ncbi:hypothetical protein R3Q06_27365 [Rhodococcus erythropolis]|uniref:hypothetical protein n=1 Tax=Rhodococcus erythropolis TaxID=1833 RepID=UPI00294A1AE4|nr:hypothetical protein [Rhodococcus erythropolis]MDV6277219.1 hypothetical protein [Rhodococcus erythropolis]
MTIIFEDFQDLALRPDKVAATFHGVPYRTKAEGDGMITPTDVPVYADASGRVTSPDLDPGPGRVTIATQNWQATYDFMIPDSGSHRLSKLEQIVISNQKVITKGEKGDTGAGVTLSGSVPTYADLGPGPWDLGAAFVVNADGLLYIYGMTGWPADGEGAAFRGERGLSISSVAVQGNQLQFGLEDSTALPKVTVPALTQASADAASTAASRTAVDTAKADTFAARDATLTAKGQVDTARTDTLDAKASVDASAIAVASDKATTIAARDVTLSARAQAEGFASTASAEAGAASTSATSAATSANASSIHADRSSTEADRAEAAADEIATGAVADNAISTIKVQDGAITKPKLGTLVQASLDKADSAVQGSDARLSDARTPTAHTHTIGNITGLQTALDGKSATSHTHAAADISDATTVGRNVMKATDAAAARSAIGAGTGTSNLAVGTTSTTAMRGDANQFVTVLPTSGQITGVIYHVTE